MTLDSAVERLHSLYWMTFIAAITGLCIFIARLLSIYFNINLPEFRFKS